MPIILYGYQYSVYTRIVRMVLAANLIEYRYVEVDPFAAELDPAYFDLHPFGRVPVIKDRDFILYETAAISLYLDDISGPVRLSPSDPENRARMIQCIQMIDRYGYWPMVRQVFAQRVFRVAEGGQPDEQIITEGKVASWKFCNALEKLLGDGEFLAGPRISLADLHLAAMMAYFTMAPEGRGILNSFPRLRGWWQRIAANNLLCDSDPGLPAV